jgi:hypothetical protein
MPAQAGIQGVVTGGNTQSLDSGFRRKDEMENSRLQVEANKTPRLIAEGYSIERVRAVALT